MSTIYDPIATKLQNMYQAFQVNSRAWIRWLRLGLLLGLLIAMGCFSLAAYSQSPQQQLEAAVQQRDWARATLLIDQLIQQQPQDRAALEAYRSRVLQLQQQDRTAPAAPAASEGLTDPPQPVEHRLPGGLARLRYDEALGDYLNRIDALLPGDTYLRWTQYPVSVYIQPDNQAWSDLVQVAVDLWTQYIRLNRVSNPNTADIVIERMPNQGVVAGIAKSTDFYLDTDGTLQHKVSITIGEYPSAGPLQISVVATHELGHALGLWGHSEDPDDIMFASLTSLKSEISDRDLNTIKRVYEQPTLIGTPVPEELLPS